MKPFCTVRPTSNPLIIPSISILVFILFQTHGLAAEKQAGYPMQKQTESAERTTPSSEEDNPDQTEAADHIVEALTLAETMAEKIAMLSNLGCTEHNSNLDKENTLRTSFANAEDDQDKSSTSRICIEKRCKDNGEVELLAGIFFTKNNDGTIQIRVLATPEDIGKKIVILLQKEKDFAKTAVICPESIRGKLSTLRGLAIMNSEIESANASLDILINEAKKKAKLEKSGGPSKDPQDKSKPRNQKGEEKPQDKKFDPRSINPNKMA